MANFIHLVSKHITPICSGTTKFNDIVEIWPVLSSSKRLNSTCKPPIPTCKPIPEGTVLGTCAGAVYDTRALVLGVYGDDEYYPSVYSRFTNTGLKYNRETNGRLGDLLKISGPALRTGEVRLFYDFPKFGTVAIVGLGKQCGYNKTEQCDTAKENIRIAVGSACKEIQKNRMQTILVESMGHAESAAEGAALSTWMYQELKTVKTLYIPQLDLYDDCDWSGWFVGLQKAAAQNLCRQLMDTPGNLLNPTLFAQNAVEVLCKSGVNVEVKVKGWVESQKMGAFLSVAKGSCAHPIFLELSYYGAHFDDRPIVMIGSGITFDSGGVCLKDINEIQHMRGDVSGAACVVAAARAIAELKIPINFRGLIPLCENMPGCFALKPGDLVTGMSGKKILVENTNCEGRLIISDALTHAQNFWPVYVVDLGSLTTGARQSVGVAATPVFTNSDQLWRKMKMASIHTGDRVWRYPLWEFFRKQVVETKTTDIKNEGRGKGGGSCRAAAFLKEFVPCGEWMHMDTYNVMFANGKDDKYLRPGMSGRPTRTVVEFLAQLACFKCD